MLLLMDLPGQFCLTSAEVKITPRNKYILIFAYLVSFDLKAVSVYASSVLVISL